MSKPFSLILRSTLLFALIAALVVSCVGFYLYYSMEKEMIRRADYQVAGRVQYFRQLLGNDFPLTQLSHNPGLFENMLGNERDILRFRLLGQAPIINVNPGHIVLPEVAAVPVGQTLTLQSVHHVLAEDDTPVRFALADVRMKDGQTVEILAGHFMAGETKMLDAFRWEIIASVLLAYVLIAGLGYVVIRRGLRPLQKMANEAAKIHPTSLSTRLSEEGAPLELQQLIVSFNAMLDRLSDGYQRLNQFSADLAHEIRTPVGALMGHCQVALYQTRTTEEYETLLANNMGELERISRMVENILFLARASHARSVLNIVPLSMENETLRVVDYFEGLAEERGIRLACEGEGVVFADALLFQRALSNLVANAINYGDENSEVKVWVEHQAQSSAVNVDNAGPAIPTDQIDKLFDRFYRADPSRSEGGSSNGLGLAIVQAIMTLHRGSVSVSNLPQGRTRFTLTFPRA
ncbi:heavy metal sensor histidine kinase [Rouxiella badensis]|jgi:two-component system heavy metal sensor histidine kinase CusS|uniref:Sensor protein n=2 Tax=Rouxiella badensis TaxID=1646377 RepID=A0A1X0WKV1_9GAMM|nr:heavy metal sensor histidine kinase [Rouxiella badensis]MCC3701059.1 heavy metal sensor histidine kinase [Rouxiella badensis]MCC3745750.1 heavy metal sensor histidine kinase [Rouxiella badensis]ORJ27363.1 two-component sensor histidine kinase [Rouxiella badensis]QOI54122.1 heavy metal sensor histidine kinase [Rouxiella badensis subsp. acadiensis]